MAASDDSPHNRDAWPVRSGRRGGRTDRMRSVDAAVGTAHAWTFLALGGARQFAGNTPYDDRLSSYYSFDSTVPNHRHVRVGDLAVLRDSVQVLGMGWISRIDSAHGEKTRRRCPHCRTTALKRRVEKEPTYRCDAGHEFAWPLDETVAVINFRAHYGESWRPLCGLSVEALDPFYRASAKQHAIRSLDLEGFASAVAGLRVRLPAGWWDGLL